MSRSLINARSPESGTTLQGASRFRAISPVTVGSVGAGGDALGPSLAAEDAGGSGFVAWLHAARAVMVSTAIRMRFTVPD